MYERPIIKKIMSRLGEPKVQILLGARQVGKTTLMKQTLNQIKMPSHYVIAEGGYTLSWIDQQWAIARAQAQSGPALLIIDEIQKIDQWSERVKRLLV